MKKLRVIARQRHIDPKTGKKYSDAKLVTVNAYYEDVIEVEDSYDKNMLPLQLGEQHPELSGWTFQIIELD